MKIYGVPFEPIETAIKSVPCYTMPCPSVVYEVSSTLSRFHKKYGRSLCSSFFAELALAYLLRERADEDIKVELRRKVTKAGRVRTDVDVFVYPSSRSLREGLYFEVLSNGDGNVSISGLRTMRGHRGKNKRTKWSFLYEDRKDYDESTKELRDMVKYVFVVVFKNSNIVKTREYSPKKRIELFKDLNSYLENERKRLAKKGLELGLIVLPLEWNGEKEWPFTPLDESKVERILNIHNYSATSLDFGEIYGIIKDMAV